MHGFGVPLADLMGPTLSASCPARHFHLSLCVHTVFPINVFSSFLGFGVQYFYTLFRGNFRVIHVIRDGRDVATGANQMQFSGLCT